MTSAAVLDAANLGESGNVPGRQLARYVNVLAVFLAVLIFLDLPNYVHAAIAPGLPPKIAYYAMFALSVPVFAARSSDAVRWLWSPYGLWIVALALLNLVHLAGTLDPLTPPGISARIQTLVLMLALSFVLSQADHRVLHTAFLWIALLAATLVLVDFIAPERVLPRQPPIAGPAGDNWEVYARASGTLLNPNKAGEVLVLLLLLSSPASRRMVGWLLIVAVCAAVAATVSRSSIVSLAFVLSSGFLLGTLPRIPILLMAGAVVLLLSSPSLIVDYLAGRADFGFGNMDDLLGRLSSLTEGNFSDDSSWERFRVLYEGWRLFTENPFTGAGAGVTEHWELQVGVHNQAILMLAEYGVLGGILWLAMLLLPFVRLARGHAGLGQALQCSGVLFLFSAATHNMLGFNYWLAGVALFSLGWPPARAFHRSPEHLPPGKPTTSSRHRRHRYK